MTVAVCWYTRYTIQDIQDDGSFVLDDIQATFSAILVSVYLACSDEATKLTSSKLSLSLLALAKLY